MTIPLTPIRGILFDKDGTLLDFEATWGPLNWRAARHAAGRDEALARRLLRHAGYDEALARSGAGTVIAAGTTPEIAETFAELLPGTDVAELSLALKHIFDDSASSATPVPGAHQTLTMLGSRVRTMGVATHDSLAGIHNSLGPHGLLQHFTFLAGSDSGRGHKPGPGMLQAFCRATGLAAHEVCVVGDNLHDLDMGRNGGAGIRVGVLTGTSSYADLAPHADLVLPSLVELAASPDFLARLGQ